MKAIINAFFNKNEEYNIGFNFAFCYILVQLKEMLSSFCSFAEKSIVNKDHVAFLVSRVNEIEDIVSGFNYRNDFLTSLNLIVLQLKAIDTYIKSNKLTHCSLKHYMQCRDFSDLIAHTSNIELLGNKLESIFEIDKKETKRIHAIDKTANNEALYWIIKRVKKLYNV